MQHRQKCQRRLIVIRDVRIENEQHTVFARSSIFWRVARLGFRTGAACARFNGSKPTQKRSHPERCAEIFAKRSVDRYPPISTPRNFRRGRLGWSGAACILLPTAFLHVGIDRRSARSPPGRNWIIRAHLNPDRTRGRIDRFALYTNNLRFSTSWNRA